MVSIQFFSLGDAGDSLEYHNGMKFTTKDRDNDRKKRGSCALACRGAWWYDSCHHSNLNGLYLAEGEISDQGTSWLYWKNIRISLKETEMKIRPAQF